MATYTGWGIGKRPFTPQEYKKSKLSKSTGATYGTYVQHYVKYQVPKKKRENNQFGFNWP